MDALVKAVSELWKQLGIQCKSKDFTIVVKRLLKIPRVVGNILSLGGKSLRKVIEALQKVIREQETWKAARDLLATPKSGAGAATQTLHPPESNGHAEPKDLQEGDAPPQTLNPDPPVERQKQVKSFWGGLAEKARDAAKNTESEKVCVKPPPCASQDGAKNAGDASWNASQNEEERQKKGQSISDSDRKGEQDSSNTCKHEGGQDGQEKGRGDQKTGGGASRGQRVNQSVQSVETRPHKTNASPSRGQGEPRGREWPSRKGGGHRWGRSPTKGGCNVEVTDQWSSISEADTSWDEWSATDSDSGCEGMSVDKVRGQDVPVQGEEELRGEEIHLTDWRKIRIAYFISRSVQAFALKWDVTLTHSISYDSTGQAIGKRVNQTLKSKLEVLAKSEAFTNAIPSGDQAHLLATALLALNQFPKGEQLNNPSQKHWATQALEEDPLVVIRNELGEWEQGWRLVLTGRGYAAVRKDDTAEWCPLTSIKPNLQNKTNESCEFLFTGQDHWTPHSLCTQVAREGDKSASILSAPGSSVKNWSQKINIMFAEHQQLL